MNRKVVHCFQFLLFLSGSVALELSDVIEIHEGRLQGLRLKTVPTGMPYHAFKGIPYAEPPVGKLRFKEPVSPKPWKGVFNATKDGAECVQNDELTGVLSGSEDCLFVNVYTPILNFKNLSSHNLLPVMVWIFGGSFTQGYSKQFLYGPDYIVQDEVILVTFNYRVGALGFLATDHSEAPGNAGLKDQAHALKWVQKNIAYFGGNPKSVTIFGQSAGSVSVDLHLLSDLSKGLFARSISMSGSVLNPWAILPLSIAKNRAFQLGSSLGYNGDDTQELIEFLRNQSAYDIVEYTSNVTALIPFKPTIEDSSVPEPFVAGCPIKQLQSGNFTKRAHMLGFVPQETLYFLQPTSSLPSIVNFILTGINNIYKMISEDSILLPSIFKTAFLDILNYLSDVTTDFFFIAGIDLKQRLMTKNMEEELYYYLYSYQSKYNIHQSLYNLHLIGTTHSDDWGAIFYTAVANITNDQNAEYNIVRRRFTRLFTNFAKYENPTPRPESELENIKWPDSKPSGQRLEINNTLTVIDRNVRLRALVFESLTQALYPLLAGCDTVLSNLVASL